MNSIQTTDIFDAWLGKLKDKLAQAAIKIRIRRAELGNFGDCKPIGEGVSEMRIHTGAGYRVYFKQVGMEIYILLVGGSKSTQAKDVDTALQLARQIGE
ncbi:MAG: type II toxin-antitoxin system RelE/ParE family toxin [Cytophagales bacterium]|nr:type II toxin-antitoxin system RelE/ParE family toxin [Cytophagales bacterium]